jgi:hypothetical protein
MRLTQMAMPLSNMHQRLHQLLNPPYFQRLHSTYAHQQAAPIQTSRPKSTLGTSSFTYSILYSQQPNQLPVLHQIQHLHRHPINNIKSNSESAKTFMSKSPPISTAILKPIQAPTQFPTITPNPRISATLQRCQDIAQLHGTSYGTQR